MGDRGAIGEVFGSEGWGWQPHTQPGTARRSQAQPDIEQNQVAAENNLLGPSPGLLTVVAPGPRLQSSAAAAPKGGTRGSYEKLSFQV